MADDQMVEQVGEQRVRQTMQQTVKLGLAFNPVAAMDGQGEAFTGGLQNFLQEQMAKNKWFDTRFVTPNQVENAGWQVKPGQEPIWNNYHGQVLYNAAQLDGMPSLDQMLAVADQQLQLASGREGDLNVAPVHRAPLEAVKSPEVVDVAVAKEGLAEDVLRVGPARRSLAHGADQFEELVGIRPTRRTLTQLAPSLRDDAPEAGGPAAPASEVSQGVLPGKAEGPDVAPFSPVLLGSRFKERVEGSGEYFREGAKQPAFTDQGESLLVKDKSADSYQAVMELARQKGWVEIELTGKPEQLARGWLEAQLLGIKVANYLPQEQDWKLLDERRESLGLPPADRAEALPQGAALVVAGLHIGPVKAIENGYVVQDVGQGKSVAHPVHEFVPVPVPGDKLEVQYRDGKVASWRMPQQGQGKELGR